MEEVRLDDKITPLVLITDFPCEEFGIEATDHCRLIGHAITSIWDLWCEIIPSELLDCEVKGLLNY